jgi:hypothetical protein
LDFDFVQAIVDGIHQAAQFPHRPAQQTVEALGFFHGY